ncbi:MAG: Ig-like domain-containing protein, partial [Desulfobacterales bacterium]
MKKHFFHLFLILAILAFLPVSSMAGSATLNWQPNPENDLGGYRVYYGTSSRTYGPPLNVNTATTCTLDTLSEGATYYFAVTAYDTSENESGFSTEVHKTLTDGISPEIALSSPTSGGSYTTGATPLTVKGTAADNVGVTQVVWSNPPNGSGTATLSGGNWTAGNIPLSAGTNTLTFTARDAAGNNGSKSLVVTYTAPDTAAPTVSFSSPTSGGSYATGASPLTVKGTAADNVGVTQVTWSNPPNGSGTATLSGGNWTAGNIPLSAGTNTLTFIARDAAGNNGSKSLVVTYT